MKPFLLIVASLLALTVASAQGHQQAKQQRDKVATPAKATYTCIMHPEVSSDKPGKCPKCGMTLVLREAKTETAEKQQTVAENSEAAQKIHQAQSLLAEAKRDLAQDGKYNCCIKDPCDRCALDHQSCPCGDEVKKGKAVCPDCYAGWQRGDGIVKGVDPKKVKGGFHSHHHEH